MAGMLDKTIVDLKLSAHVGFTMAYLGARATVNRQITKSTII